MLRFSVVLFCLTVFLFDLMGQNDIIIADFEIHGDDTIFYTDLPEIEVLEFTNNEDRKKFLILKRRVLKVYPYALIAKNKITEIELALDSIPKRRKKKRYTKDVASWIKDEYKDRLKNLSMNDGKILVKLIYRETEISSYDIVKLYRGRFNAFFWQGMAKIWNNNLKTVYDPINIREDILIEHIIKTSKLEANLK